jgi:peptidoglycan/LPS O-acetylase OafA/YrhL
LDKKTIATGARRLRVLDALRGLAAISVVLFHFTSGYGNVVKPHTPRLTYTFNYGYLGVELFFVISGFVILMTLEKSKSLVDFAVSRFARLYPPYIACGCITAVFIYLVGFNPQHITAKDGLIGLVMMSELTARPALDPSYWSLTYEVIFYIFAVLVYLSLEVRRIEIPCLIWLAIAFAGHLATGFQDAHNRIAVLLNVEYSFLFVLGMMVCRLSSGERSLLTWFTLAAAFGMSAFGARKHQELPVLVFMALIALFVGAVWLGAIGRLKLLEVAPLLLLGDISYSLYLVHQIAGYWVIERLEHAGVHSCLAIGVAVLSAIVTAVAIRSLVELRVQRAIRSAFAARFGGKPRLRSFQASA